jgi:hypothetical protein
MKKLLKVFFVTLFVLAFCVPAAYAASGTVDAIFDGYCDGFSFNYNTATGLAVGAYTSSCATCPYPDALSGAIGKVYSQGNAAVLSWSGPSGIDFIFTVIQTNGNWTHYGYDGTVFNQGTWSPCPAASGGALPSTSP